MKDPNVGSFKVTFSKNDKRFTLLTTAHLANLLTSSETTFSLYTLYKQALKSIQPQFQQDKKVEAGQAIEPHESEQNIFLRPNLYQLFC